MPSGTCASKICQLSNLLTPGQRLDVRKLAERGTPWPSHVIPLKSFKREDSVRRLLLRHAR